MKPFSHIISMPISTWHEIVVRGGHLLGFVHGVDKNGAVELRRNQTLEHELVELVDGGGRHKDVKQGVGHGPLACVGDFPRRRRFERHLSLVHAVQELENRGVGLEN